MAKDVLMAGHYQGGFGELKARSQVAFHDEDTALTAGDEAVERRCGYAMLQQDFAYFLRLFGDQNDAEASADPSFDGLKEGRKSAGKVLHLPGLDLQLVARAQAFI